MKRPGQPSVVLSEELQPTTKRACLDAVCPDLSTTHTPHDACEQPAGTTQHGRSAQTADSSDECTPPAVATTTVGGGDGDAVPAAQLSLLPAVATAECAALQQQHDDLVAGRNTLLSAAPAAPDPAAAVADAPSQQQQSSMQPSLTANQPPASSAVQPQSGLEQAFAGADAVMRATQISPTDQQQHQQHLSAVVVSASAGPAACDDPAVADAAAQAEVWQQTAVPAAAGAVAAAHAVRCGNKLLDDNTAPANSEPITAAQQQQLSNEEQLAQFWQLFPNSTQHMAGGTPNNSSPAPGSNNPASAMHIPSTAPTAGNSSHASSHGASPAGDDTHAAHSAGSAQQSGLTVSQLEQLLATRPVATGSSSSSRQQMTTVLALTHMLHPSLYHTDIAKLPVAPLLLQCEPLLKQLRDRVAGVGSPLAPLNAAQQVSALQSVLNLPEVHSHMSSKQVDVVQEQLATAKRAFQEVGCEHGTGAAAAAGTVGPALLRHKPSPQLAAPPEMQPAVEAAAVPAQHPDSAAMAAAAGASGANSQPQSYWAQVALAAAKAAGAVPAMVADAPQLAQTQAGVSGMRMPPGPMATTLGSFAVAPGELSATGDTSAPWPTPAAANMQDMTGQPAAPAAEVQAASYSALMQPDDDDALALPPAEVVLPAAATTLRPVVQSTLSAAAPTGRVQETSSHAAAAAAAGTGQSLSSGLSDVLRKWACLCYDTAVVDQCTLPVAALLPHLDRLLLSIRQDVAAGRLQPQSAQQHLSDLHSFLHSSRPQLQQGVPDYDGLLDKIQALQDELVDQTSVQQQQQQHQLQQPASKQPHAIGSAGTTTDSRAAAAAHGGSVGGFSTAELPSATAAAMAAAGVAASSAPTVAGCMTIRHALDLAGRSDEVMLAVLRRWARLCLPVGSDSNINAVRVVELLPHLDRLLQSIRDDVVAARQGQHVLQPGTALASLDALRSLLAIQQIQQGVPNVSQLLAQIHSTHAEVLRRQIEAALEASQQASTAAAAQFAATSSPALLLQQAALAAAGNSAGAVMPRYQGLYGMSVPFGSVSPPVLQTLLNSAHLASASADRAAAAAAAQSGQLLPLLPAALVPAAATAAAAAAAAPGPADGTGLVERPSLAASDVASMEAAAADGMTVGEALADRSPTSSLTAILRRWARVCCNTSPRADVSAVPVADLLPHLDIFLQSIRQDVKVGGRAEGGLKPLYACGCLQALHAFLKQSREQLQHGVPDYEELLAKVKAMCQELLQADKAATPTETAVSAGQAVTTRAHAATTAAAASVDEEAETSIAAADADAADAESGELLPLLPAALAPQAAAPAGLAAATPAGAAAAASDGALTVAQAAACNPPLLSSAAIAAAVAAAKAEEAVAAGTQPDVSAAAAAACAASSGAAGAGGMTVAQAAADKKQLLSALRKWARLCFDVEKRAGVDDVPVADLLPHVDTLLQSLDDLRPSTAQLYLSVLHSLLKKSRQQLQQEGAPDYDQLLAKVHSMYKEMQAVHAENQTALDTQESSDPDYSPACKPAARKPTVAAHRAQQAVARQPPHKRGRPSAKPSVQQKTAGVAGGAAGAAAAGAHAAARKNSKFAGVPTAEYMSDEEWSAEEWSDQSVRQPAVAPGTHPVSSASAAAVAAGAAGSNAAAAAAAATSAAETGQAVAGADSGAAGEEAAAAAAGARHVLTLAELQAAAANCQDGLAVLSAVAQAQAEGAAVNAADVAAVPLLLHCTDADTLAACEAALYDESADGGSQRQYTEGVLGGLIQLLRQPVVQQALGQAVCEDRLARVEALHLQLRAVMQALPAVNA